MDPKINAYDRAVKIHAVRRVIEEGHCPHRIAAELEINSEQLQNWIRRYAISTEEGPGRFRLKTSADELRELRREVESLKHEQINFMNSLKGNYSDGA
jgi:transposase-like protein